MPKNRSAAGVVSTAGTAIHPVSGPSPFAAPDGSDDEREGPFTQHTAVPAIRRHPLSCYASVLVLTRHDLVPRSGAENASSQKSATLF